MIEVPYIKELEIIRKNMEIEFPYFPATYCAFSTRTVHKVFGLEQTAGYYNFRIHAWNYDSEKGLYIDLTLDQFPNVKEKINVYPEDNPCFFESDSLIQLLLNTTDEDFTRILHRYCDKDFLDIVERIKSKL